MSDKENHRQEGVLHLARVKRLSTWVRDDRRDLERVISGISDLAAQCEALLIQEKYGLSVTFHEDGNGPEFEANDPAGCYLGVGNTPAAAILLWDYEREDHEKSPRPASDEAQVSNMNTYKVILDTHDPDDPVIEFQIDATDQETCHGMLLKFVNQRFLRTHVQVKLVEE